MDEKKTTVLEQTGDLEDTENQAEAQDKTMVDTGMQTRTMAVEAKPGKSMILPVIIGLLVVALVVMAYFLFFKSKGGPAVEGAAQIRQMQELTQQVQGLESEVKDKENEVFSLVDEVKEKTGAETLGVNAINLNEDEKKILEKRINEEKDVSVKSLLQEILDKNNEIQELKGKIAEIEALLPRPHVVARGENHFKIAMDFLVNEKGIDQKEAMKLVERTAIFDELVPGFKVWNFYTGDAYGTSVTQGTAGISPNTLIRRAKKKLVDARDEAISQRDQLSEDIKTLEDRRKQLIDQMDSLTREKEGLIGQVSDLNVEVNSLFYLLDSQKNLKKQGILKGGFLKSTKLRDVSPEYFNRSIDMRTQTQVVFSASELGLKKIKSVEFYPKFYREGTDYKIEISGDKQNGIVTILDAAKFKNERIVISVK
jgi:flagellar basal body-associated protein FliL